LTGHTSAITDIELSDDEQTVISVDIEGVAITHDIDLAFWKTLACRRANRNLTADEWTRYLGDREYQPTCPDLAPETIADPATPAAAALAAMTIGWCAFCGVSAVPLSPAARSVRSLSLRIDL
jgi:hypothetical protein